MKVIAQYTVLPGKVDELKPFLLEMARETRKEQGNLKYELFQGIENKDLIIIDEEYTDEAALDFHRNSLHFERIVKQKIIPLLKERKVTIV